MWFLPRFASGFGASESVPLPLVSHQPLAASKKKGTP